MRGCEEDDCDRPHHGRGLCKRHYNERYKHKPPTKMCEVDGCRSKRHTDGLCNMHFNRMRRASEWCMLVCRGCKLGDYSLWDGLCVRCHRREVRANGPRAAQDAPPLP